ncbi:hypothetical protein SDC9_104464 [bioreactor metagenome]|uniref:Uncharacterized protein n=1 Tax=bioreactor metagenome TaxID=1076179 RepID=A0A645AZB3_9ZZZZ
MTRRQIYAICARDNLTKQMIIDPSDFSDVGRFGFLLPICFGVTDDSFYRFGEDRIVDDGMHKTKALIYRSLVTIKINLESLIDRRVYLHQQFGALVRDVFQHESVILPVAFIDLLVEFRGQYLQIQRVYKLVVLAIYDFQGQRAYVDIRDDPSRRSVFF